LEPIRVLIADLPGVLHAVVREALSPDDEIVVVATRRPGLPLGAAVQETGATVVIVCAEHPEAADPAPPMLAERARLRVLAVSADGRESVMYELQPRRRELGELSPAGLLEAVRATAGPPEEDQCQRP
jgi:chemotaxis response regulator CheB